MDDRGPYIYDFAKRTGWWERDPGALTTFSIEALGEFARRLGTRLAQYGIRPDGSSFLGELIRNAVKDLPESQRTHACPPGPCVHLTERVIRLQRGADLVLIERAVERVDAAVGSGVLASRLRDLASGAHAITAPAPRSNQGDRAFELVCAGAIGRYAEAVSLEEPDVLCTFEGQRWGVACKATSGTPAQAGKLIREGARQLQGSAANCGIVIVRITDVFPHEQMEFVPEPDGRMHCFADPKQLPDLAYQLIRPFGAAAVSACEDGGVVGLAHRYPKLQAVAFVGNTIAHMYRDGDPAPVLFPVFACWTATSYVPPFCDRLRPALSW